MVEIPGQLQHHFYKIKSAHRPTAIHCLSVARRSEYIACSLGINPQPAINGALVHDIGKLRLPLDILEGGLLTDAQRQTVKRHPRWALDFLPYELGSERVVAVAHHEFQKDPYPRKEQKPIEVDRRTNKKEAMMYAELVAAADAVDALAETRTYRPKDLSYGEIVEIAREDYTGNTLFLNLALQTLSEY